MHLTMRMIGSADDYEDLAAEATLLVRHRKRFTALSTIAINFTELLAHQE